MLITEALEALRREWLDERRRAAAGDATEHTLTQEVASANCAVERAAEEESKMEEIAQSTQGESRESEVKPGNAMEHTVTQEISSPNIVHCSWLVKIASTSSFFF